jgi:hypothetical protein
VTGVMCGVTTRVNDAQWASMRRVLVLLERMLRPEVQSARLKAKATQIAGLQVGCYSIITYMVHMRHKPIESS